MHKQRQQSEQEFRNVLETLLFDLIIFPEEHREHLYITYIEPAKETYKNKFGDNAWIKGYEKRLEEKYRRKDIEINNIKGKSK